MQRFALALCALAALTLTTAPLAATATFSYAGTCHGGCYQPSGEPLLGVEPGLTGYISFADGDILAASGIEAGRVTDYAFEHAGGGTYSAATGFSIRFENLGFNAAGDGFGYLDQGQASGPFPIGYVYLEQGLSGATVVSLQFAHDARHPEQVDWSLATYNTSLYLTLDSGTGAPFAAAAVPLPAAAWLLLVPLGWVAGVGARHVPTPRTS